MCMLFSKVTLNLIKSIIFFFFYYFQMKSDLPVVGFSARRSKSLCIRRRFRQPVNKQIIIIIIFAQKPNGRRLPISLIFVSKRPNLKTLIVRIHNVYVFSNRRALSSESKRARAPSNYYNRIG